MCTVNVIICAATVYREVNREITGLNAIKYFNRLTALIYIDFFFLFLFTHRTPTSQPQPPLVYRRSNAYESECNGLCAAGDRPAHVVGGRADPAGCGQTRGRR